MSDVNDSLRRRLFSEALEKRLYEKENMIPDACLRLSFDVSRFSSDAKKKLFETCLNLVESKKWEPNTFNYACDPEGLHEMATIKIDDVPKCFMKIDYDIITLMTADEY